MTPDKPKKKKKGQGEEAGVGKGALASNQAIVALAMAKADPWQKILVYTCYGVIVIGVVLLTVPPWDSVKQLVGAGMAMGFLLVAYLMVSARYKELTKPAVPDVPTTPSPGNLPERRDPVDVSEVEFERIRRVLADARSRTVAFLRQKEPGLANEHVRANIFLPEYGPSVNGQDCLVVYQFDRSSRPTNSAVVQT